MKRSKDQKAARAILEAIIRGIDTIPEEAAADIALTALEAYQEAGGDIDPGAVPFIIGPRMGTPDPGRPAPGILQLSHLLKNPKEAPRIEEVMRRHVKRPPDLAALVEALRRLKKLSSAAANKADVWRATRQVLGPKAGSEKGLSENWRRAASKAPGEEGKIARKIEEFITILTR